MNQDIEKTPGGEPENEEEARKKQPARPGLGAHTGSAPGIARQRRHRRNPRQPLFVPDEGNASRVKRRLPQDAGRYEFAPTARAASADLFVIADQRRECIQTIEGVDLQEMSAGVRSRAAVVRP